MKRKRDVRVYLEDIAGSIRRIQEYINVKKNKFLSDKMIQDAVMRNFSVMGEAVKKLPRSITAAHPEIPWSQIAKMRDVIIHDYAETNMETVWDTCMDDLPSLEAAMEELLKKYK